MQTHVRIACAALLLTAVVSIVYGQNEQRRVGSIAFFGYSGLNLDQIKSALPIPVGDPFVESSATRDAINKAVTSVVGRSPTDVAAVCCDAQGNYMIFIGLPGASIKEMKINPVPQGDTRFPPEIVKLYDDTMDASSASVLKGDAQEDTSKGYSLSVNDLTLPLAMRS